MKRFLFPIFFQKRSHEFTLFFFIGIIISFFIHFSIFKKIRNIEITSFNPESYDVIIPRKFHLARVEIDPKLLEEKEVSKIKISPKILDIPKNFKSSSEENKIEYKVKPGEIFNQSIEQEKPNILESNMIPQSSQNINQPSISLESSSEKNSINQFFSDLPSHIAKNYSEVDTLIEKNSPLSSQTAPILLPTDLLFEYDADSLKVEAENSLKKLALLIQRNPKANFIVEGFTDSFGSDSYNLDLSNRRALSIKKWLIQKQGISENQISTKGFGKSHFIVPSSGSIEQQGLNRRVEIVIRQNDQ